MTAGTGVTHSEFNHSSNEPVHPLQIWLLPARQGLAPGYEQLNFAEAERRGRLRQIASPDGADGSITIHQDARIHAALLEEGDAAEHRLESGRKAWLQVARGAVTVNGTSMSEGDGAAIEKRIAPHHRSRAGIRGASLRSAVGERTGRLGLPRFG